MQKLADDLNFEYYEYVCFKIIITTSNARLYVQCPAL